VQEEATHRLLGKHNLHGGIVGKKRGELKKKDEKKHKKKPLLLSL